MPSPMAVPARGGIKVSEDGGIEVGSHSKHWKTYVLAHKDQDRYSVRVRYLMEQYRSSELSVT